jgi:hypothetical protein
MGYIPEPKSVKELARMRAGVVCGGYTGIETLSKRK